MVLNVLIFLLLVGAWFCFMRGNQGKPLVQQMVLNLLMFLLLVGAIYIFAYPNSQLATTTTAISQIWSGTCRLNCRRSQYSGFSGLSGLGPGNSQGNKSFYVAQAKGELVGPNACVCASCPCELIENVLRSFRPATTVYSTTVNTVAYIYYAIIATLLDKHGDASETIYFGNKRKDGMETERGKSRKPDWGMRQAKSIIFRDKSETVPDKQEGGPSKSAPSNAINSGQSDATLKPNKEDEETKSMNSGGSNGCPKCVQQGKVCMKNCPKAGKKKKKSKNKKKE